jgi:hypothetical protein
MVRLTEFKIANQLAPFGDVLVFATAIIHEAKDTAKVHVDALLL